MPPATTSRCCGVEGETTTARRCPERDDCERHAEFTRHGPGANPAPLWLCASEDFEARIPRPCAGAKTRVSNRPHPLCRNCSRWQFGIADGITPDWRDEDGTASCGHRVVHGGRTIGDATATPQVGGVG